MSDSDLSDAPATPSDATLESSLRREVMINFKSGNLTVKKVRELSEEGLLLEEGFYVNHPKWKAESKRIIKDEAHKQEATLSSPIRSAPPSKSPQPKNPIKRQIPDVRELGEQPSKKQKKSAPPSEDEGELSSPPSNMSSMEENPKKKAGKKLNGSTARMTKPSVKKTSAKPKPRKKSILKRDRPTEQDAEASEEIDSLRSEPKKSVPDHPPQAADDSDSALSSLVDEEPKPKQRRESKDTPEMRGEKPNKSKAKATMDEDPDAEEIKRLQGWLVKCGIRKLWGKELKPYETPKAKIKHLKDMLTKAGMTGRYSQEKATQIKEQRELAADIEAVKEGAERWGKDDEESEGGSDKDRPQRRLVRGAKAYDFLSSDGEETD